MPDGFVHIYYGKGKGKTSAATGMALRSLGQSHRVLMVRFLKTEKFQSGEIKAFKRFKKIKIINSRFSHPMFYQGADTPGLDVIRKDQKKLLVQTLSLMKKKYDLVVFDEVLNALSSGFLSQSDVMNALKKGRLLSEDVVLTGLFLPAEFGSEADLITEFREKKHYYTKGVEARKGIEY